MNSLENYFDNETSTKIFNELSGVIEKYEEDLDVCVFCSLLLAVNLGMAYEIAVKHTDCKEMFSMLFGEIWDSIEKHPSIKNFKDCVANNAKQQSGSVDSPQDGQTGGIQS